MFSLKNSINFTLNIFASDKKTKHYISTLKKFTKGQKCCLVNALGEKIIPPLLVKWKYMNYVQSEQMIYNFTH